MNQNPPPPDHPNRDTESHPDTAPETPESEAARLQEPPPDSSAGSARWEEPRADDRDRYGAASGPASRPQAATPIVAKSTWLRLLYIVLFAIVWSITEVVLTVVVVVQFLCVLLTGERHEGLRGAGQSLARYAYQIFRYLTFNSDMRPFPFDLDWPTGRPDAASD